MPQERGWGQEMGFHKVGVTGQGSAVAKTEGTGLEQCLGWGGGGGLEKSGPWTHPRNGLMFSWEEPVAPRAPRLCLTPAALHRPTASSARSWTGV